MVEIRDFREADAPVVRSMMQRLADQRKESTHHLVLKQAYASFFPAYLQSFLSDPDSVMKVAEANGAVVGYAIATRSRAPEFYRYSRRARLTDVFVEEAHRGHGVARALLAALEEWARRAQLQALEVEVFPQHEEEIKSLMALGFTQDRIRFLRPLGDAAGADASPARPARARRT